MKKGFAPDVYISWLLWFVTNPWKFSRGDNEEEWREYGSAARLNLTSICAEANTCESYFFGPEIWVNVPKGRYDTCSDEQCEHPTLWVKELNPFDPGLDLVRSRRLEGKEYGWWFIKCDYLNKRKQGIFIYNIIYIYFKKFKFMMNNCTYIYINI